VQRLLAAGVSSLGQFPSHHVTEGVVEDLAQPRQPLGLGHSPELAAFLVCPEQRFLNHVRLVEAPPQATVAAETAGQATQDTAVVFLAVVRFSGHNAILSWR
jgi:hypothetical protein